MAYDLSARLFVENGPAVRAANARSGSSSMAFRAWRRLDRERRLALVDEALRQAANDDLLDGYPVAL